MRRGRERKKGICGTSGPLLIRKLIRESSPREVILSERRLGIKQRLDKCS